MRGVKLIDWKAEEVEQRENLLRKAGYKIGSNRLNITKEITDDPPISIVIDLSRLPSQGRDFALLIRSRKGSRDIPIVFVDIAHEIVMQVR